MDSNIERFSFFFSFLQAARQSQIPHDSYHEKHREHPEDSK